MVAPGWMSTDVQARTTVGHEAAGQPVPAQPQAVGQPVPPHGVQARVAEHDLDARARRRVALADGRHVPAQ